MPLFDDSTERNDQGPILYAEPKFVYLNRSGRSGAQRIRELLEAWFSHYPEEHKPEFRARFRSPDNTDYVSAFFELCVHELLLLLDDRVEIHPALLANARRPDFFVRPILGSEYYLEAVTVMGESRREAAEKARMNAVYDALNRMDSADFFVGMKIQGAPETPPSARRMRRFLGEQLAVLNPDALARHFEAGGFEALPHWRFEHEGWQIDFFPMPKPPELRGRPGIRPIGLQFEGFRFLDRGAGIRDAIVDKAGNYGDLRLPYVVAVNAQPDHVDEADIMAALFGAEQIVFQVDPDGTGHDRFVRAPDGAWTSLNGPRYTRVSAVLVATQVSPSSLAWGSMCLYHNPWAVRSYEGRLNRLNTLITAQDGRVSRCNGLSLADVFQLPANWPN